MKKSLWASVTKFGTILSLLQFLRFLIWAKFWTYIGNFLCYLANFYCSKWLNIEQILISHLISLQCQGLDKIDKSFTDEFLLETGDRTANDELQTRNSSQIWTRIFIFRVLKHSVSMQRLRSNERKGVFCFKNRFSNFIVRSSTTNVGRLMACLPGWIEAFYATLPLR